MANQTCGDGGSGYTGRNGIGLRRRRQGPSPPSSGSGLTLHDLFDSVRRFINSDTSGAAPEHPAGPLGGIGVSIISCGGSSPASTGRGGWGCSGSSPIAPRRLLPLKPVPADKGGRAGEIPLIRWRKGEMIGSGAFGQFYLGINLDTGSDREHQRDPGESPTPVVDRAAEDPAAETKAICTGTSRPSRRTSASASMSCWTSASMSRSISTSLWFLWYGPFPSPPNLDLCVVLLCSDCIAVVITLLNLFLIWWSAPVGTVL